MHSFSRSFSLRPATHTEFPSQRSANYDKPQAKRGADESGENEHGVLVYDIILFASIM